MYKLILVFLFLSTTVYAQDLTFEKYIQKEVELSNLKPFQNVGYFQKTREAIVFYDANLELVKSYEGDPYSKVHLNENGVLQYQKVEFINGVKKKQSLAGYINKEYELVIPLEYKTIIPSPFSNYVVAIRLDDVYEIFNAEGTLLLSLPKDLKLRTSIRSNPFIFINKKDNKTGLMNLEGEVLLNFADSKKIVYHQDVYKGKVAFREGDEVGLMNEKGEVLWEKDGFELKHSQNGVYALHNSSKSEGFRLVDEFGEFLNEGRYTGHHLIKDELVYFKIQALEHRAHGVGLYDDQANLIESYEQIGYNELINAFELRKAVYLGSKEKPLYLKDGKILEEDVFYKTYSAQAEGGVLPRKNASYKYGLIDANGNYKVAQEYSYISKLTTDKKLMLVSKDGKNGIIDLNGREIVRLDNHKIHLSQEGLIYIKKNEEHQLLDLNKKSIIPHYLLLKSVVFYKDKTIGIQLASKYPQSTSVKEADVITPVPASENGFSIGYQFIDQSGKLLFNKSFVKAGPFIDGVSIVRTSTHGPDMLIDKKGELYTGDFDEENYTKKRFSQHITKANLFPKMNALSTPEIRIETKNNTRFFTTEEGKEVVLPPFVTKVLGSSGGTYVYAVYHGYTKVGESKKSSGPFYINFPKYLNDKYHIVRFENNKLGIKNEDNETLISGVFEYCGEIIDDKLIVRYKNKLYLLNMNQ